MRELLEILIDLGCQVTLLPDNGQAMEPYTRELQRLGIEVLYGGDQRMELGRIGAGLSLVILSRAPVAARWLEFVREVAPSAPIVFDTLDLHWLREARRAALGGNGASLPTNVTAMRELEVRLARDADATLVVTEEERAQVLADVPEARVHVVPTINHVRDAVPPPESRTGVLFVGGFEHAPNVEAVVMLVREVMPLVWRELGRVPVAIVGSDAPPEVQALASELVDVRGWVPDLDPVLDRARLLLAPLTYGAGLKGKVTQALAFGLPVVTTPIGAEGLDAVDGEHMLIGESADALAERTLRVLRDDELWHRLSCSGQKLAADRCSSQLVEDRLRTLLDELVSEDSRAGFGDHANHASRRKPLRST
jgi:hypothetical protein